MAADTCRVACVVVLVTGLPGAGKSTIIAAIQDELGRISGTGERLTLLKVLRLDEFYEQRQHTFSPETWHSAADRLFAACEAALRDTGNGSGAKLTGPLLLFVEDNMHYRSMRDRHWRLCRDHQSRAVSGAAAVAMMELRVEAPVSICLERNEQRQGGSSYIPPHVITSMDALFERCLSPDASSPAGGDASDAWHVNTNHTQPWLLVTCTPATPSETTPDRAARMFLDLLASPQVLALLRDQVELTGRRAALAHDAESQRLKSSASFQTASHRFDLSLRALVRFHMQGLDSAAAVGMQRQVLLLKQASLLTFKQEQSGRGMTEAEAGAAVEEATRGFEAQLIRLSNWQ